MSRFQEILAEPLNTFQEIHALTEQVESRHKLWSSVNDYEKTYKQLIFTAIKSIDPQKSSQKAEEYLKVVRRSENILPQSTVLDKLKGMVEEILEVMPVITALRAPLIETH